MTQRLLLVFLLLSLPIASACKSDGKVQEIVTTIDSFTTELINRIDQSGNPSAGLDDAQKYFDSRHQEMSTRISELKALRESQVSIATKEKLSASLLEDATKVGDLQIKYVNQSLNDPSFKRKLDKLTKDYQLLLTE